MANVKSHQSAIIIGPPAALCNQIQEIRKKHDKAYVRWMPHINLVYPYYKDEGRLFEREALKLVKHLSRVQPFQITFNKDSIGCFTHGRRCTIWLKPLMTSQPAPAFAPVPGLSFGTQPKPEPTPKPAKKAVTFAKKPAKKISPTKPVVLAPASMPRPTLPPARTVHQTLLGYPDPIPPSTLRRAPLSGLDALSTAFWTPENTRQEVRSARGDPASSCGLSALRFAVWGAPGECLGEGERRGEGEERYVSFTKVMAPVESPAHSHYGQTSGFHSSNVNDESLDTKSFLVGVSDSSSSTSEDSCSGSSDSSDSETGSEEEQMEVQQENVSPPTNNLAGLSFGSASWATDSGSPTDDAVLPARSDGHNPYLMALQGELERAYPDLNDLSTRSEEGFQPHLTLGQCSVSYANAFMADLRKSFVGFTFDVRSIELISRGSGICDPFKVKMSVPLGGIAPSMAY